MWSIPFTVERSTIINKQPEAVFIIISDFTTWPDWSPWLNQEPDCPVKIEGTPGSLGHRQTWNGKKIGSGHIELTEITPGKALKYDLFFIKPWKSQSTAAFTFEEEGDTTRITWSMKGALPIYLFFMKKKMSNMVENDYERGLTMLKELLEPET